MSYFDNQNMPISEYFTEAFIAFDKKDLDHDLISNVPFDEAKFGILNLQAIKAPEPTVCFDFIFTIDCSGSMSDLCSDKRTKMQHIIHTMKNIIWFFNENTHITVFITIFAFDNAIYNILNRCQISKENTSEIIEKIDAIKPRNSTDIELALNNAANYIVGLKEMHTNNRDHNIVENKGKGEIIHIFMTDGDPTSGERDPEKLNLLVDNSVSNFFIGFGIYHDYKLLDEISNGINSTYYFIDKLETSGLVYGEVLHNALYTVLKNVEINCENSLIYDYKTNSWTNKLSIGNIFGESNKIYHIVSDNPFESSVYITFNSPYGLNDIDVAFEIGHTIVNDVNFEKYLFRQRTLQILYEVKNLKKVFNPFTYYLPENDAELANNNYRNKSEEYAKNKKEYTVKLKRFIDEIQKYMADHNLENDKFLKNLCDDIYICYKTFGKYYQNMFLTARQTSQGAQRQYTASSIPDDDFMELDTPVINLTKIPIRPKTNIPILKRSIYRSYLNNPGNYSDFDDNDNDNDDDNDNYSDNYHQDTIQNTLSIQLPEDLEYNLSQFEDTPYITPSALKIMRSVSGGNNKKTFGNQVNNDNYYDMEFQEASQAI